jgi:hypothetical protein
MSISFDGFPSIMEDHTMAAEWGNNTLVAGQIVGFFSSGR